MSRYVIGAIAKETGLSAKTIRYYEESGLIPKAERGENGYRLYNEKSVHRLRFVKRARDLGFSVEDVRNLLALWDDEERPSAEVKSVAQRHLNAIEEKIDKLQAMRKTLKHLIAGCHGDERPDCPILDDLASLEDHD